MTKEDLAKLLDGRQIGEEISEEEERLADENGLVVVFGSSDDLMEMRGGFDDEFGLYEGGVVSLDKTGPLTRECESEDCPHEERRLDGARNQIKAIWDDGIYSWRYETEIPHATFEVLEGVDKYCRGIVFSVEDLL